MRYLVNIQPTINAGKKMIKDLKSIQYLESYIKKINGESAYFYEFEGRKTFEFVIDVPKGSHVSDVAEPMFKKFDARITFQPVRTLDELKKSVSKNKK
ncbi:MAG: hypothetical protein K5798_02660 [Nitrosopumilus sp.]|uniref:hypothetical protein n=1 Tax=Nitrosopumilus sp. TaxID=2024843 RepID=UPI002430CFD9|nr:hypothetical protein [Nitrosopumilus sp.]MCV0366151.1 hypothetical protein [Nitrosopumilus sp.]